MTPRPWQRAVARMVLLTFTTSVVACGGSPGDGQGTTTATAMESTTSSAAPTTAPPAPPPTAPPTTIPGPPPQQLGREQLRELVAPVALYPDVVLASLLPATTSPDQLHEAAQYVGNAARVDRVPDDRGWDGSVVGLLQFPDVLRWLDANPAWTDEMGQAVTYQQADVLQAIQDYRRSVRQAGNLESNRYQVVRAEPGRDIRIEPAQPDVVYVPSYDPAVATQPQPQPQAQESQGINPWLAFGGGAVVGALGAWALYSIFDDDDGDTYNYYGGYGRGRRIRRYDNYYYARGRRPRPVQWTPRPRPYRDVPDDWRRPRRLEHVSKETRPVRVDAPLRPPLSHTTGQAPRPADVRREQRRAAEAARREQRQERQQVQQQQKAARREQRQERQQVQQQQKAARREQRQEGRQAQQAGRAQRQQQQREAQQAERRQRQEGRQAQQAEERARREAQQRQQRERREQRQEQQQQQRQERREQRQDREQARQERRQEQREQRQQNRAERQGGGGRQQKGKNKQAQ